jgi:hypothetical protein
MSNDRRIKIGNNRTKETHKEIITSMMETEFEWITEIPIYFELEPCTIYYFEPNLMGDELSEILQRVNPSKIRQNNVYEWLSDYNDLYYYVNEGIKYFVTDHTLQLDGWCDTSPYEEARDEMYPKYNFVDGRTL